MKQKILRKRGALQEGFGDESPARLSKSAPMPIMQQSMLSSNIGNIQQSLDDDGLQVQQTMSDFPSYVEMNNTNVNIPSIRGAPVGGTQSMAVHHSLPAGKEVNPFTGRLQDVPGYSPQQQQRGAISSLDPTIYGRHGEFSTMFRHTIPEGQKVLVFDRNGQGTIVDGPKRILRWGRRLQYLSHHVAYPGEFLIVRHRDGLQKHIPGPCEVWMDPRIHVGVEKEDALQIAAKEAVVVYSRKEEDGEIHRRTVMGPAVFVPEPGEWLHTFSWHGSDGAGYRKVPGAMVFQKLWFMPDQMYHDVDDVRTADDVVLTVRLMIFFELADLERMLDETHDPIGDFVNAASSDVLDLVGRYTFDNFKSRTDLLNNIENYPQLHGRAKQVGYKLHKLVYRGYSTSHALEAMHGQAIETRTRLKLERETETQAQELADFKQQREAQRAVEIRNQEKGQEQHEMEKLEKRHEQQLLLTDQRRDAERKQRLADMEQQAKLQQQSQEKWLQTIASLKEMGVDLSAYLTQGRADNVIELRGPNGEITPHLHLPTSGE